MSVCLFCRGDSSSSRSVEHVVPESLGNKTMVLPPTIVCDECNNYFARKVEAPVLGADPILALRHFEVVANKRGRVPSLQVSTSLGESGVLRAGRRGPISRVLSLPPEVAISVVRHRRPFEIAVPDRDDVRADVALGRFVTKIALEAIAARCADPLAYASLLSAVELDACRLHARYGVGPRWPVRVNRIHPPDRPLHEEGREVQRVWEYDFLITAGGQLLFAVAFFGLEFAINVLEPEAAAYPAWLASSGVPSLLYPSGISMAGCDRQLGSSNLAMKPRSGGPAVVSA